jgi:hypothetical protein
VDEAATRQQEPASPPLSTTPTVAAISVLGVLLTGLCLTTADRLARSAPAQVLAVLTVGAALISVMVAVAGHLWAALPSDSSAGAESQRRRRVRVTLLAGTLSLVAIVLAAAAALIVVLEPARGTQPGPAATFHLTGAAGAAAVSVQFSVPGLRAGSPVDTRLIGVGVDLDEGGVTTATSSLLARSLVPADAAGLVVTQLAAPVEDYRNVVLEATMPGRTCRQTLPLDDAAAAASPLACTRN